MLHVPVLRSGRPYRSMDVARAVHYRTREPFVEISQANVGLVRRDLLDQTTPRSVLAGFRVRELIAMCGRAGDYFLNGRLPLGDAEQSPADYIRQLAATTGMPHSLAARNMKKIHSMMANMETVLRGLSRNLDLDVLDRGYGEDVSFFPRSESLGVVLPSNSPGVHSLWIPAIPLKTPLVLKPGGAEPWTPYRIAQALMRAGVPAEAFGYYPTDHAGSNEILRSCGRGMLFGDVGAVKGWAKDPRIELHGPGWSKIVLGADAAKDWEKYLDVMVSSIVDNGGRSCVNSSGVWTPSHGDEIAAALGQRLAKIVPRAEDDPAAQIAPFADPAVGRRVNQMVEQGMAAPGAIDVTEKLRGAPRLAEWEGCTYLLPTIVRCSSPEHPLANKEFLFPFASVVETPEETMPEILGPTLVVTAITKNEALVRRMLDSPRVGRLNIGPTPTNAIRWDQPHEGNLFDHLYARRAFQRDEERVTGMKILSLTAGAANMYCGSCLRDNALARELRRMGHDVTLIPLYTPTRTDEDNESAGAPVLFGGISVYLQQQSPIFRHTPWLLDRLWDSRWALQAAARRSVSVDPKFLGGMTVSMLEGEQGALAKEFLKLQDWLMHQGRPEIIHLPNTLLISLAGSIRRVYDGPLCCTLQGEDLFLRGLQEPYRSRSLHLIRQHLDAVDAFVSVSVAYADEMSALLAIPREKIHIVPLGIETANYSKAPRRADPWTLGYLARIAPEKGLHLLAEGWRRFRSLHAGPARLVAAGYLAPEHQAYLEAIRQQLGSEFSYRGEVDQAGKAAFLSSLDAFCVPAAYDEPKGIYVLEAMAAGVPVVAPARGALKEHIDATGGGLAVAPDDPDALARAFLLLREDGDRADGLARQGYEGVRSHYSLRAMAERTLVIYASLLRDQFPCQTAPLRSRLGKTRVDTEGASEPRP